ncbi:hypothetical protein M885DRAFT_270727 [Pelagophyceae sp. CCMP2097]|nr:hypothetical protein M885DRAFT_270727 [Pelagophyceae sp. CCMP2097]
MTSSATVRLPLCSPKLGPEHTSRGLSTPPSHAAALGAEKLGITTKEELCALIISLADCVADADDGADVVDRARLAEAAKGLSESITAGATDEDAEALDADEFWRALGLLDASLSAVAAERTAAAGVATLVDEVYTNEDGTIDAVHLLHDLRLWPGVEESAHWDALAEDLRSRLCEGAQAAGIKTKEAFCQLFADADGRPRKMGVEEFVTTCRDHLGLDLSAAADDGEARDEGELVQFVRWFTVEEDGEEAVDVGELLWKLLLWPGSEEEHRSLNAGRQLRQELLAAAEGQELETVGDLYTALVARCHGGADAPAADASLVDDAALQVIALPKLLDALAESFGVDRTADLEMYLQHFPPTDSEAEAEKEEATVPFEEKKVDLKRLLQHLELFDQDEECVPRPFLWGLDGGLYARVLFGQ